MLGTVWSLFIPKLHLAILILAKIFPTQRLVEPCFGSWPRFCCLFLFVAKVLHSFLLWYTINENCMIFSLLEISFNWFWFKEEGNVSVYIVIILLGRPRSQETHIVTSCPPHAICVKICFYANRCWNYTWKDMRPPMY